MHICKLLLNRTVILRAYLICRAAADARSNASVAMRDGPPPADADRVTRNNQRGRQLAALEFVGRRFDPIENVVNQIRIMPGADYFFR